MTGRSLESWVLRRNDADGLEAVEVRRRVSSRRTLPSDVNHVSGAPSLILGFYGGRPTSDWPVST